MVRRYYVSRLVGAGTSYATKRHPKVFDLVARRAVGSGCMLATPANAPGDWCLCWVDTDDHAALVADPDTRPFPAAAVDAVLTAGERGRARADLAQAGVDLGVLGAGSTLRTALGRAAQSLAPDADLAWFTR